METSSQSKWDSSSSAEWRHRWGDFKSGNGSSCILPKLFSNIPQLEGWPEENREKNSNLVANTAVYIINTIFI